MRCAAGSECGERHTPTPCALAVAPGDEGGRSRHRPLMPVTEGRRGEYRRRAGDPGGTRALVRSAGAPRAAGRGWGGFRVLRIFAGFVLLLVGFVGLFLPVLQGVLLILAGLAVLGRDLPWARAVTGRLSAFVRRRAAPPPAAGGKGAGAG